jgi:signal transduction histidine kinase
MAGFAALGTPQSRSVDVAALLDELLDAHHDEIRERRLLVLKELDRTQPNVPTDREHLRFAFGALLDKALSLMPERGDLYLASKHHGNGLRGLPSVRILLRYHSPHRIALPRDEAGVSLAENTLELVIAETLVSGLGGRLTIDSTDGEETVLVVDLPA